MPLGSFWAPRRNSFVWGVEILRFPQVDQKTNFQPPWLEEKKATLTNPPLSTGETGGILRFGGSRFQVPRPSGVEQAQQLPGPGLHLGLSRRVLVVVAQQM